jgi:hypothetical protein
LAENQNYPGTPRWVKTLGKIAALLAVLAVLLMVFGGGQHGPWRHFSSSNQPASAPSGN